uniref:Uncharacterized protein n=1 Tax=Ditylenchus dipsaci TaxID=166011 RepID=A0A915CUT2_9BILA
MYLIDCWPMSFFRNSQLINFRQTKQQLPSMRIKCWVVWCPCWIHYCGWIHWENTRPFCTVNNLRYWKNSAGASASVLNYKSVIHPWMDVFGILIISVGMGGIVPCVASFGGDQFEPHQERMISVFFSIFYASINSGALISTIILPILRM